LPHSSVEVCEKRRRKAKDLPLAFAGSKGLICNLLDFRPVTQICDDIGAHECETLPGSMQSDPQFHDLIENHIRDLPLGRAGELDELAAAQSQRHFVLIRFKPTALLPYEVSDDHVAAFSFELATRFRAEVLGLRGKADEQPIALLVAQLRENI